MVAPSPAIQGIPSQSSAEVTVAQALDYYQLSYTYQYPLFGGTQLAGGEVIDFMVWTTPRATPVEVQSLYWHGPNKQADELKYALLQRRLGSNLMPLLEIWDDDWATLAKAKEWVKANLV